MSRTLGARYNPSTLWCDINTSDGLVVTFQFILELELMPCSTIQLNTGISGDSQRLPVSGEGMVGDGVVEKVVDFGAGHFERIR